MTHFDSQLIDSTILDEINLSNLWFFREDLNSLIPELERLKDMAINLRKVKEAVNYERQLYYITRNLQIVEEAMLKKENQIFEFLHFEDFCLN